MGFPDRPIDRDSPTEHRCRSLSGCLNPRNPRSRSTETDPDRTIPNRTPRWRTRTLRSLSCFPCGRSDYCLATAILMRDTGRVNAHMAPILRKRHSVTSTFRLEATGLPLKARYSGGVWGGEGAQGNRMSVTETPGRWVLRGREGAILATARGHGPESATTGRRVRRAFSRMSASG